MSTYYIYQSWRKKGFVYHSSHIVWPYLCISYKQIKIHKDSNKSGPSIVTHPQTLKYSIVKHQIVHFLKLIHPNYFKGRNFRKEKVSRSKKFAKCQG